ncbi:hypothetical protein C8Q74DRAFT_1374024 [Fomes fomentarius]|nr:hypothetical protein C8Q74DRAFT_1374024 [Fomes fomentarius]
MTLRKAYPFPYNQNRLRQSTPRKAFPSPFILGHCEPITLVELRMHQFSSKIRSKPNWWEKVKDAAIVAKWHQEIVNQDRLLIDKLWGGEEYFEHGDGGKKWPREPITAATLIGWVYESRSLISPKLKGELLKGVALLEDIPEDEQNWHPGSNNQINKTSLPL